MTPEAILAIIATELASSPLMDGYVALARIQISPIFFGTNYNLAVALKAAHEWVLNTKRSGQSGVLTYEMSNRMSRSFGGVGVIRNDWDLSNYGLQYKALVRSCGVGATSSAEGIIATLIGR